MFNWMKMRKLEKGQALSEYAATFPGMIVIGIVLGAAMGPALFNVYQEVVDSFKTCTSAPVQPTGETTATFEDFEHTIELVENEYDPETDTTTVTYRVSSNGDPSISHWMLGISEEDADRIQNMNEEGNWESRDNSDPSGNGGIAGLKFDTGYESAQASTVTMTSGYRLTFAPYYAPAQQELITSERDITMSLVGQYEFVETEVAIKAGQLYDTTVILAPVYLDESGDVISTEDGLPAGCE